MPDIKTAIPDILKSYGPTAPAKTAAALRELWLQFAPQSIEVIKAELRAQQETIGIPVPILKSIGAEIGKVARKQVEAYIPLAERLWHDYGREGRVVSVHVLGPMELTAPATMAPHIITLCRTCITWEDADQLAMYALEPIVRKKPAEWFPTIEAHIEDENKWLRRACITVAGRLAMKNGDYIAPCLALAERLLFDQETDVKRAVSFAIRLAARCDTTSVRDFLAQHIPPANPAATWVLCDTIRSMGKKILPDFVPLLETYTQWAATPDLDAKDKRSIESAIKTLNKVA